MTDAIGTTVYTNTCFFVFVGSDSRYYVRRNTDGAGMYANSDKALAIAWADSNCISTPPSPPPTPVPTMTISSLTSRWATDGNLSDILVDFTVNSDYAGLFDLNIKIDGTAYGSTVEGTAQPAGTKSYTIRLYDIWTGTNPQFDTTKSHTVCGDLINVRGT